MKIENLLSSLGYREMNHRSKRAITTAMNEWGFVSRDILVVVGKSATDAKFNKRCGFEQMERVVHSNPHSS